MKLKRSDKLWRSLLFLVLLGAIGCAGNSSSNSNLSSREALEDSGSYAFLGIESGFEGPLFLVKSGGEYYLVAAPIEFDNDHGITEKDWPGLDGVAPVSRNIKVRGNFVSYHDPKTSILNLYSVQDQKYVKKMQALPNFDMDDYYLSYFPDDQSEPVVIDLRAPDMNVDLNVSTSSSRVSRVALTNSPEILIFREDGTASAVARTDNLYRIGGLQFPSFTNPLENSFKFIAKVSNLLNPRRFISNLKKNQVGPEQTQEAGNEVIFKELEFFLSGEKIMEAYQLSDQMIFAHNSLKMNDHYLVYLSNEGFQPDEPNVNSGFGTAVVHNFNETGDSGQYLKTTIENVHSSFVLYSHFLFYVTNFIKSQEQTSTDFTTATFVMNILPIPDGSNSAVLHIPYKMEKMFYFTKDTEASHTQKLMHQLRELANHQEREEIKEKNFLDDSEDDSSSFGSISPTPSGKHPANLILKENQ